MKKRIIDHVNLFRTTDPGLGESYSRKTKRIINRDGTFNVKRTGMTSHLYQDLIGMNHTYFFSLMVMLYLVLNLIFAIIYFQIGVEHLGGSLARHGHPFMAAYFFSMQTFTTVGFGAIFPNNPSSSFVAGMEAMAGLLFFALATGLVYGRFSKPSAKILFSNRALIAPFQGGKALMIRIVNTRPNVLLDLEARMMLVLYVNDNGLLNRKYFTLKLSIDRIYFFPMSWTIVHPIDKDSPLFELTADDLKEGEAEVLALVKGFDETFGQQVHARNSYVCEEIVWGAKFVRNFSTDENGEIILDIDAVHLYETADITH